MKSIDKVPGTEIPQQPGVTVAVQDHNETLQKPAETAITTRIASSGISTWSTILIILIMNIIVVAMYYQVGEKIDAFFSKSKSVGSFASTASALTLISFCHYSNIFRLFLTHRTDTGSFPKFALRYP